MHTGEAIPVVRGTTPMRDVIYEMSKKGFGITAVVDDAGSLLGVISDGDLRRLIERDELILQKTGGECCRPNPRLIESTELASAALQVMEQRKITSLFIVGEGLRIEGILHLHDLWGLELF